ncbi:MAG: S26 family signal peptidase [Myxococcales bacterium]|jgi:signal peptidase I
MKVLKFFLWIGAILGVLGLIAYATVFDVWTVPGDDPKLAVAVEPSLSVGDVLLVTRHGENHSRGELLRCDDPQAAGRYIVGRLVGLQGEKLAFEEELVVIGGKRTSIPYGCADRTLTHPTTGEEVALVCSVEEFGSRRYEVLRAKDRREPPLQTEAERGVFLVSDNRHMHLDSRDYGSIAPSTCRQVVFRLWGTSGFGDSDRRLTFLW